MSSIKITYNKPLFFVFCAAIIVGIYQLSVVFAISGDGPVYIDAAKKIYSGDFHSALSIEYPPLYPFLTAIVYSITRNWVAAGRTVSFVLGILTIFPVYFLVKKTFNKKIAFITILLLVFHPFVCKYWVRVLSESTYIFLLACSVWLSWKAIEEKKYRWFFLAGVVCGLNYLNRPEGIGVVLITALFAIFARSLISKNSYKKKFLSLCILAAGTAIVAGPYILYTQNITGRWQLSRKKSVTIALVGNRSINSESVPAMNLNSNAKIPAYSKLEEGYFKTLLATSKLSFFVYCPPLFLLLLIAFFRRKVCNYNLTFELYIAAICVFYVFIFSLFYASDRHLVPLISISIFWAAIGFYELNEMALKFCRKISKLQILSENTIFMLLLGFTIIAFLPATLKTQDRDKVGQKNVGKWMKENCKQNAFILTDMARVVFYAEGYFVSFKNRPGISNYKDLVKFAKTAEKHSYGYHSLDAHSIDYIVIDRSTISDYCPDFLDAVDPNALKEIYVLPNKNDLPNGDLIVYEVQ